MRSTTRWSAASPIIGTLFLIAVAGLPCAGANDLVVPRLDTAKLATVELNALRFEDPGLEITKEVRGFPPGMKALWRKALAHDEADMRRQTADAIARAHAMGMNDARSLAGDLASLLQQPGIHPLVRLSVARALVTLDARQTAPVLARQSAGASLDYARVVEPALAQWGYAPRLPVWREQLENERVGNGQRVLAIRCLGIVADTDALPALELLIAARRTTPSARLEAARTVARTDSERAVPLARSLLAQSQSAQSQKAQPPQDPPPRAGATHSTRRSQVERMINRLAVALLLRNAQGSAAQDMLEQLARDPEPTVVAAAIQRLLEIAPEAVVSRADELLESPDSKVRLLTAHCLAARPAAKQVERLAGLLSDPHPHVRRFSRATLREMADRDQLTSLVHQAAADTLRQEDWRGLEQAALLVAQLDYEPAGPRLLPLLDHPRGEVMLTAAWALRELAIADTLPDILANAQTKADSLAKTTRDVPLSREDALQLLRLPAQLALLFELFGKMEYREAESLLRQFVPKNHNLGDAARAAAIWSLGILQADKGDQKLAEQLSGRLSDLNPLDPEDDEVRRLSAVSLGRMKSESQLRTLEVFYASEGDSNFVGRSCGWAISHITGQPLRPPGIRPAHHMGWFLTPLKPTDK